MESTLLREVRANAIGGGLNLFGVVDGARFDAGEPKERRAAALARECGTILVFGTAGRWRPPPGYWPAGPGAAAGPSPCVVSRLVVQQIAADLAQRGIGTALTTFEGGCRLHAGRLGEAAGFGTVSPVSGLLLHPQYGPWLRVRAALLCDGLPFGPIPDASIAGRFQPCSTCSRPCVCACPAGVHDGGGSPDLVRCGAHRHAGGCAEACATRAACPVGGEHRDAEHEAVHCHSHELATMQRWFGLGVWRLVPKRLRGGP